MKEDTLKKSHFAFNHGFIKNPEVIRIKTIKKKYIDQIDSVKYKDLSKKRFNVIGRTSWVILFEYSGCLYRCSHVDYISFLCTNMELKKKDDEGRRIITPEDRKNFSKGAQEIVRLIPLIFED